ncbi:MAG: hypothetical protein RLZ96_390 [Actinomycetota bacterium]
MNDNKPFFGEYRIDPLASAPIRYYSPQLIDPHLQIPNYVHAEVAFAESALAELRGLLEAAPLLSAATRLASIQESLDSSRIEGTRATLSEILLSPTGSLNVRRDIVEVRNLQAATELGISLISEVPIGVRVLREMHAKLMSNGIDPSKTPGEFRKSFVWIGKQGQSLENAELVPPAASELPGLLADWERFVNSETRMPAVYRSAIAHYQFETIHPFLDGNGRIGRLVAVLMLISEGVLPGQVISLSSLIEANREGYYKALREVRLSGDMAGWVEFWAKMLRFSAEAAMSTFRKLQGLRESLLQRVRSPSLRSLVDLTFRYPVVTVPDVTSQLGLAPSSARELLRRGVAQGFINELGPAKSGSKQYWVASQVWQILTDEVVPGGIR